MQTSVYKLDHLGAGDSISGPAVIIDKTSTIIIEPHCHVYFIPQLGCFVWLQEGMSMADVCFLFCLQAKITEFGDVSITLDSVGKASIGYGYLWTPLY